MEVVLKVVLSTEGVSIAVVSTELLPSVVISGSKYTIVVPAVDGTIVDVSNGTPVELTEGIISAEVVPIVVLSTEMAPRVAVSGEKEPRIVVSAKVLETVVTSVVSAEVVPRVVLSTEVVPSAVISTDVDPSVVISAEVVV